MPQAGEEGTRHLLKNLIQVPSAAHPAAHALQGLQLFPAAIHQPRTVPQACFCQQFQMFSYQLI
jgi:hypothetical protein